MPAPENERFSVTQRSRIDPPRLSFEQIKREVLGQAYTLSLVFIGDRRSVTLNDSYRNRKRPTNVLSFPLSPAEGEIFINLRKARDEAPRFGMPYRTYVGYLLIHGMLHLKGMEHGSTMEKEERRLLKRLRL